jgi:hypothetical protein
MVHLTRTLCASLALGLMTACVPETPIQTDIPEQVQDVGFDSATDVAIGVDTMDGTWLHFSQMSTCVRVGVQSFELLSRTIYIVDVEQTDEQFGTLSESWTACDIELTELLGLLPRVSDGLLEHGFPVVTERGQTNGTAIGSYYASGPMSELWGLEMDDPTRDIFPDPDLCERVDDPEQVECSDDRIVDMDQDGLPGVTLQFNDVCQAYVVQRTTNHFSGPFVRPDRIEGNATGPFGGAAGQTLQVIMDATESLCTTEYGSRSNDAFSSFARQRIDGQGGALNLDADGDGRIVCDEVMDAAPQLFSRRGQNNDHCER